MFTEKKDYTEDREWADALIASLTNDELKRYIDLKEKILWTKDEYYMSPECEAYVRYCLRKAERKLYGVSHY